MTPFEKASLAEQLMGNPLLQQILSDMEKSAVERLIFADNEQDRVASQMRVLAVRTFRSDCESLLRSTRAREGVMA